MLIDLLLVRLGLLKGNVLAKLLLKLRKQDSFGFTNKIIRNKNKKNVTIKTSNN